MCCGLWQRRVHSEAANLGQEAATAYRHHVYISVSAGRPWGPRLLLHGVDIARSACPGCHHRLRYCGQEVRMGYCCIENFAERYRVSLFIFSEISV